MGFILGGMLKAKLPHAVDLADLERPSKRALDICGQRLGAHWGLMFGEDCTDNPRAAASSHVNFNYFSARF